MLRSQDPFSHFCSPVHDMLAPVYVVSKAASSAPTWTRRSPVLSSGQVWSPTSMLTAPPRGGGQRWKGAIRRALSIDNSIQIDHDVNGWLDGITLQAGSDLVFRDDFD